MKNHLNGDEEKKTLLYRLNHGEREFPLDKTLQRLFAEQAERTPDHVAVIGKSLRRPGGGAGSPGLLNKKPPVAAPGPPQNFLITYRELDRQSGHLAHLLQSRGVKPDTLVGLKVERSLEMVLGVLGILKAGGAYLPLDPLYPRERIKLLLTDSAVGIVLSESMERDEGIETLAIAQAIEDFTAPPGLALHPAQPTPQNLAYLLYTSGSTGTPKGVGVEHGSLVNLLIALFEAYPISPAGAYLLKTSFFFDVSATELFGWFMGGSRLAILEKGGEKEPRIIIETIARHGITHINFAPAMFNAFTRQLEAENIERVASLRYIFLAGEALPPELVHRFRRFNTAIRLENLYGPTEGTVYASWYSLTEWNGTGSIPIGKPLPGVRLYILDQAGQPITGAETGELCIAGIGTARGYINNPELTAERFVTIFNRSSRSYKSYIFYRTGDLARWLPDGNIDFLGRIDHQVKIRGIRIELGEIESRLLTHPGVKEAVVTARATHHGDKSLCAYIVPGVIGSETSLTALSATGLREYLTSIFPDYMVPQFYIFLERLPLNNSGKVDRKALPEPVLKRDIPYAAPRHSREEKLVEIWAGALGIGKENIGIDDGFLELGGHSLTGAAVVYEIHKRFAVKITFAELLEKRVIRKLSAAINGAVKERYLPLEKAEKKEYYALSPAQKRIYILYHLDPEGTVYNLPALFAGKGEPDKERLEETFKKLIARHHSFRTCFMMEEGVPVQRTAEETFKFQVSYYTQIPGSPLQLTAMARDFIRPFDLSRAPLLRVGLVKTGEKTFFLMMDQHHIITDGFSMMVLMEEFTTVYRGKTLPPLRLQYNDYSEWQHREQGNETQTSQKEYWLKEYSVEVSSLTLPLDYPRPLLQNFEGETVYLELSNQEVRGGKTLARAEGVTLSMLFLAAYNVLLAKLSGQEDIVVGIPLAGRKHPDLHQTVGMFVNTLAVRNLPAGKKRFNQFLQEVKEKTLLASENQGYPFEELVEMVVPERDPGRNPLFDCVFTLENLESYEKILGNLNMQPHRFTSKISKFDLTLTIEEYETQLILRVEYCKKLFKPETPRRFIAYFRRTLQAIQNDPGQAISELEMISAEEKKQLLFDFNPTSACYSRDFTLNGLFEAQVDRTPDQGVLVGPKLQMTYKELNERSGRLAFLLKEEGVRSGAIVGIMVERSVEMHIGILAILKAGAAYLPLGPDFPEERNNYMLKDSSATMLVTMGTILPSSPTVSSAVKNLTLTTGHRPPATSLAYVIYTSGSTGKPKGVPITHANISPLLHWGLLQLNPGSHDRVVQNLSFYFDWSAWEIFITFASGAGLHIAAPGILLNPRTCAAFIRKNDITALHITPTQFQPLARFVQESGQRLQSLKYLCIGAEKLTLDLVNLAFKGVSKACRVFNMYGPTEATIISSVLELQRGNEVTAQHRSGVPIGMPVANAVMLVLNRYRQLCPVQVAGELVIGGPGLSRGYLNNPELTRERFVTIFNRSSRSSRSYKSYITYRTGDLARWLVDGNIEFLGRIDHQVKIRGFRIETGEIENRLLSHPGIEQAVVIAAADSRGSEPFLCAYFAADQELSISTLREYLSVKLPDYMIPAVFMRVEKLPVNPNGKVDLKRLPKPETQRPALSSDYVPPVTEIENLVAMAWKEVLKREKVGIHDKFFELGGNSLKFIQVSDRLHHSLGRDIPLVTLYQYPTIRSLARYLGGETAAGETAAAGTRQFSREENADIAVIGMAGRFPGAKNIDEFWENLENGRESIAFFSSEELQEAGVPLTLLNNPDYVKAGGFLENISYFDASFFNYTPRQADLMDPQLRLYHEGSWTALEDAGYHPGTYTGRIGVYSGASPDVLWVAGTQDEARTPSEYYDAAVLNINSSYATRISYLFGLRGPSLSMQTACSTSLVAVHLACRALLNGECDMALAGGVAVSNPVKAGYLFQEGMILSPDGHNRTFAAEAKGTVPGDGMGIVVLKRLKDARADRDHIYALVKGSAVNNDGTRKAGYTAPSVDGQAEVIRDALEQAKVKPGSITYVETHGTGTTMGDPIEIQGLKSAFKPPAGSPPDKNPSCALGSVKTNIGHLDMAAGIAGFIKTVLALKHRLIPPSLHFQFANPEIDTENSPFVVNTRLTQWKTNGDPLRAGVSSFGIGGTNAHVVLEEAPNQGRGGGSPFSRAYHLIPLSAKTPSALDIMTQNLARHFKNNPNINLADAAYTLQVGRKAFKHRRVLVCSRVAEAVERLESLGHPSAAETPGVYTMAAKESPSPVVFMFPGQGSQYIDMGLDLYETEAVFREELDRCFEILQPLMDIDLKGILYPGLKSGMSDIPDRLDKPGLDQTEIAQPVLFGFEYALARLLQHWGITPQAMIGHSIGEYTAACLSGVFSLEDALTLVAARSRLMQALPPGGMLSVPLPEKDLLPLLKDGLCLAAVNSPDNCVVSGPRPQIDAFALQLKEMGYQGRSLHTSHAFHSAVLDPILGTFANQVKQVSLNSPKIPYLSNVTGQWLTAEAAIDPGYWVTHLRRTVRFYDGMTALLEKSGNAALVEVGPGRVLTILARQHPDRDPLQPTLNLVRHPKETIPDDQFLLTKIGNLWLRGTPIDGEAFYSGKTVHRIPLPTYPFEKQPHRIQRGSFLPSTDQSVPGTGAAGRDPLTQKKEIGEWFYTLSWKRVQLPLYKKGSLTSHTPWLVFTDDHSAAAGLVERLEKENLEMIVVKPGKGFQKESDWAFTLDPGQEGDYHILFQELAALKRLPRRILHLWGLSGPSAPDLALELKEVENTMERGFYSLLHIARALGGLKLKEGLCIDVVTDQMQEVTGEERLCPAKAAVLGPVKTIPLEYPKIRCRSIDILGVDPPALAQLLAELSREIAEPFEIAALRRCHRWVQGVEPLRLEEPPRPIPRLKENGVYLVSGGLGGMGLALARFLAKTVNARLALIDSSPLPPSQQWEQWFNTHPENNKTSKKIREIRELEKTGATVLVFNADIADGDQMKQVMEKIEDAFGSIDGVIHTAGAPGGQLIRLRTREFTNRVLAPKVRGTLVLDTLLKSHQPDFIVLCSSLNSLIGEIGQAGYIAANCFLDAFAAVKRSTGGPFWVSINWDRWLEVGMAAAVPHDETVTSRLSPCTHWELGEHKVKGIPTLVGTAYLEIAAAALEYHAGNRDIEIRQLHYLSSLTAAEGEEKDLHVLLKREENQNQWEFSLGVPWKGDNRPLHWHARGNIAVVTADLPRIHDIAGIREMCPRHIHVSRRGPNPRGEPIDAQSQVVTVGRRWDNLREMWWGENQGLARLELPEEFSADSLSHPWHPAVLDTATAFLIPYISAETAYLPFSFKRVRIKNSLPQRVFSFARLVSQSSQPRALELDITIMDETGLELMEIEGMTVVASQGDGQGHQPPGIFGVDGAGERSLEKPTESGQTGDFKDGILPVEGVDVFTRVLADQVHQVVVSTVDLALRLEWEKYKPWSGLAGVGQESPTVQAARPRPELGSVYIPPATKIQQVLVRIWQEFLGVRQVGIHDDIFELGADSLKALTVIARIHKELNVEVSITDIFTYPTIAKLAAHIESSKESLYSSIAAVESREYYPLSSAQKRLYYLQQMHKESVFYNLPMIYILEGSLDTTRLDRAFRELIRHHESLRTSFELVHEEPVQRIRLWSSGPSCIVRSANCSPLTEKSSPGRRRQRNIKRIVETFVRPFDLACAPLLRMEILPLDNEKHLWLFDIHHIITDATGYVVLQKDLERLYNQQELPPVKVQYKDFSQWQNRLLASGKIKAQQDYWSKVFPGALPGLKLPTDYPRSEVFTFKGDRYYFTLSAAEAAAFLELGSAVGATLFIDTLAVLNILLYKYTGQGDILVGSSIAGRPHADLQDLVGMFVNMLPMRNKLSEDMTYAELLQNVKATSLNAFENQDLQLEMLVEQINPGGSDPGNPVFNVCLNVENYAHPTFNFKGLSFSPFPYEPATSKFDILLWTRQVGEEIHFMLEYSSELFKPSTAREFANHLLEIIRQAIVARDTRLKDIKLSHQVLIPGAEVPEIDFGF